ncbi:DNA/RNA polymerase superfamily protein [Gossypium australe]|uniref:DNA/RNA polymerase superfamily protein n=1 Tax=Gossypium australe TaxID=47621 RepID=A0A5B6V9X1_9ROSI|nr:DNA/RNA polymerase superfamily protein [Gossypium australe]
MLTEALVLTQPESGTKYVVYSDTSLNDLEAHSGTYSIHPSSTNMYCDLKQMYWWPGYET